jgi:hypothetical protein
MADFFKDNGIRKTPEIKAISTAYKGYLMRSRLEARWAIFFDALNIKWEYEPEGFKFDGVRYLPDFYLPTFDGGMFVEVKFKFTKEEDIKCMKLCLHTQKKVMLAEGIPSEKVIEYYDYYNAFANKYDGHPNFDKAAYENRMWACPGWIYLEEYQQDIYPEYFDAIKAARSARFEHNYKDQIIL